MNIMAGFEAIPAPRHSPSDFFACDSDARAAEWSRIAAAIAVVFLAAAHASAAPHLRRPAGAIHEEAHL